MDGNSKDSLVLVSREDSVVTLQLNRPGRMNAVCLDLYQVLDQHLADYEDDPEVRVLIITGSGRAFSVGADLDAHARGTGGAEARRLYVGAAQSVNHRIQTMSKVIVGAANGHAIGAGFEMLLGCDLSVVSEDAKFRLPEASLGTFVGGGVTRGLVRRVGRARANEMLLLCPMMTGREVHAAGLVTRAVPDTEVGATAALLAREVAAKAPLSVSRLKAVLNEAAGASLDEVLRLESEALLACMETQDWAEGIAAYKEKREPRFRGT